MAVHDQLYVALQAFAATIAGDYDVSDVLHRVCDHLVDVVGGAGAGVSVLDGAGQVRFVAAATVLAQMATAYVIRANATAAVERVNEQLQQALESRIVIGQAKGRLAGEQGIAVGDATG